jgi:hypothetical protein
MPDFELAEQHSAATAVQFPPRRRLLRVSRARFELSSAASSSSSGVGGGRGRTNIVLLN